MCLCVNSYQDLYPLLLYRGLIIGGITNSHQCVHLKLFQFLADINRERTLARGLTNGQTHRYKHRQMWAYLGELVKRGIGGVVGDEEPHALVGNLDCSGAVHVGETA